jgi:phage shock protein PspC (stress-responsive transcriptional regulator)
MNEKRLYKSRDKKVCGVCGGIAEYFGIDPTLVRIAVGIAAFCTGFGIPAYIIAALVMDEDPGYIEDKSYNSNKSIEYYQPEQEDSGEPVGFKLDDDNN